MAPQKPRHADILPRWQRSSNIHYDFAGRKRSMSDADLGNWRYAYNALGQLTRQTDARDQTSCLYYDSLGRMRGRVQRVSNATATRPLRLRRQRQHDHTHPALAISGRMLYLWILNLQGKGTRYERGVSGLPQLRAGCGDDRAPLRRMRLQYAGRLPS